MKYLILILVLVLSSCAERVSNISNNKEPYTPVIYRNDSIILFPESNKFQGTLNSHLTFYIESNGNKPVYYTDSINSLLYTICFGTSIVSYDLNTGKEKSHCLIHSNKYDINYKISKYRDLIIYQNSSNINVYTTRLKFVGSLFDSLDYKPPFCNNTIKDYRYTIKDSILLLTAYYNDVADNKRFDSINYSFGFDTTRVKLLTAIKNCPN